MGGTRKIKPHPTMWLNGTIRPEVVRLGKTNDKHRAQVAPGTWIFAKTLDRLHKAVQRWQETTPCNGFPVKITKKGERQMK